MIWARVKEALPSEWSRLDNAQHGLYKSLRYNVYLTSVFKNHRMATDLVALLRDDTTGKARSWADFHKLASPIVGDYCKAWLRTEYNTAIATSQMAYKWQDYMRHKYLRFVAVQDDRTRPTHMALNGTILPPDDPFWEANTPPLEHGCRCGVAPANSASGPNRPGEMPVIPNALNNNAYLSGQIFNTETSPYFNVRPENREAISDLFGMVKKIPSAPDKTALRNANA